MSWFVSSLVSSLWDWNVNLLTSLGFVTSDVISGLISDSKSSREFGFVNWLDIRFYFTAQLQIRENRARAGGLEHVEAGKVVNSEQIFKARSHSWVVYRFIALDSSLNFGFEICTQGLLIIY